TNADGAKLTGAGVSDGVAIVTASEGEFRFGELMASKAVAGAKLKAILTSSSLSSLSNAFDVTSDAKGTTYYVSNQGNDANDGKSPERAWASVAKVNASKYVAGDGVLFRGGDTFNGCLLFNQKNVPNTTEDAGITISAYGQGKFQLNATCSGFQPDGNGVAAIQITQLSGVTITNAILRGAQGKADGTTYGILLYNPYQPAAVMKNIKIMDNDIGGFYTVQPKKYGGEIFWSVYYQTKTSIDYLLISGNKLHGLQGPSSPDNNGIMGIAQLPVISHATIEKNVVYDIGGKANGLAGVEGNGIVGMGLNGAVIRHNVAHDLGGNANTCGGPGGIWLVQANNATIEKNEVYRVRPTSMPIAGACDWIGYDMDYSVTNSYIQYNYSHDNWGPGLLFYGKHNWGPNVARYNVSINDGKASNGRAPITASLAIGGEAGTKMFLSVYN
ncbi:MAG: right-handed parallel beta-helix repeat-containing protein, partial [Cytophagaceae bacterium]